MRHFETFGHNFAAKRQAENVRLHSQNGSAVSRIVALNSIISGISRRLWQCKRPSFALPEAVFYTLEEGTNFYDMAKPWLGKVGALFHYKHYLTNGFERGCT